MLTGSRIFGRYELRSELPGAEGQWRWRAWDEATRAEVEVVGPDRTAALLPDARAHHDRAADRPVDPAVLPWLQWGLHEGHPVAIRAPVAGPWQPSQRISAAQVAALAATLAPAARRAQGALGGLLRPADLVLRADGMVALDPAGIVRAPSLARPDGQVPPERDATAAGAEAAVLYGLGVILFTALTGTAPALGRTAAQLHQAQLRPTRVRDLLPDVEPAIDALLAGLLDPDPARRLATADALEPLPPLPIELDDQPAGPPAAVTTPPRPTLGDVRLPRWLVVVDPTGRPTSQRRDLAAHLGLGLRELDMLPPGPLLLGGAETAEQAEQLGSAPHSRALGALVVRGEGAASTGLLGGLSLAAAGIAGALTTLAVGLTGVGLVAAAISASLSGALLLAAALLLQRGRRAGRLVRQVALTERHRLGLAVPEIVENLAAARRRLLTADLPAPILADLREAADQLSERLESADVDGLSSADLAALRAGSAAIAAAAGADATAARSVDDAASRAIRRAARAQASLGEPHEG